MKKLAVLFSGKGTNFAHIVKTLHGKEVEVVVALTNNPEAEGISIAKEANIPLKVVNSRIFETREAFDTEVVKWLKKYTPDLTVLAGFMRILTPLFTKQIRAINLHPSLLPRHKGLNAIKKSYDDTYPEGGVSVHWVTSKLDSGKTIVQKRISKKGLDFVTYNTAIKLIEKEILIEAIRKVL
ncbi:MAG: phosphoribosylglycinamide formyltransferase [Sulfurovum sp.]|nr:phosphoribosylglycinamide formyltransferase [Sulfurovum sp.]MCB4744825.1 phosphoribosylglycinamide formyltransferase [Sulfurovum sp.]MCB4746041.1 phosphoribosylglycinamide formyltransferase [Sulfurovum sp.]MCB4747547.1 phosphoribosylglycinamide formyltransferase [Sulfurovum sp.]MCB4750077.1 phosphoribosylglycinamide formyltransferase [Sulfurovum sp.]